MTTIVTVYDRIAGLENRVDELTKTLDKFIKRHYERFPPSANNAGLTGSPPDRSAHSFDTRPRGDEHDMVLALITKWAELNKVDVPTMPVGDNLQRVIEALRHPRFGFNTCLHAVVGHYKECKKEGSKIGKGFRSAFPAMTNMNNQDTRKLDTDRLMEFVIAGTPRRKVTTDVIPINRRPEDDREHREWLKKQGIEDKDKMDLKKIMELAAKQAKGEDND